MPILWKAIQRKNPRDPNAKPKYYVLDETRSFVPTEELASMISERSGAKAGDILGILRTLADVLFFVTGHGDAAKLDRIGIFSASLTGEKGTDTPEELARVRKETSVNFRPATEFRDALQAAGDQFTGEVTTLEQSPPAPP